MFFILEITTESSYLPLMQSKRQFLSFLHPPPRGRGVLRVDQKYARDPGPQRDGDTTDLGNVA